MTKVLIVAAAAGLAAVFMLTGLYVTVNFGGDRPYFYRVHRFTGAVVYCTPRECWDVKEVRKPTRP